MRAFAVLLLILGFGSLILEQFNMQFRLLAWATDYQPWIGIGFGVIGLLILLGSYFSGKGDDPRHGGNAG